MLGRIAVIALAGLIVAGGVAAGFLVSDDGADGRGLSAVDLRKPGDDLQVVTLEDDDEPNGDGDPSRDRAGAAGGDASRAARPARDRAARADGATDDARRTPARAADSDTGEARRRAPARASRSGDSGARATPAPAPRPAPAPAPARSGGDGSYSGGGSDSGGGGDS